MYVCGPTAVEPHHRAPAECAGVRPHAPLVRRARLPGHLRAQRHRHRRQDLRTPPPPRRASASSGGRWPTGTSWSHGRVQRARHPPPDARTSGDGESVTAVQHIIERLIELGHAIPGPRRIRATSTSTPAVARVRGRRRRQASTRWRRRPMPTTRAASATRATSRSGRGTSRPSPPRPAGSPWGPGVRLAHRVLRDGRALPRHRVRHPRRRARPASRTTRTSSPSRPRPAGVARYWVHNGWSTSAARRCRSRSATPSTHPSCHRLASPSPCATCSARGALLVDLDYARAPRRGRSPVERIRTFLRARTRVAGTDAGVRPP